MSRVYYSQYNSTHPPPSTYNTPQSTIYQPSYRVYYPQGQTSTYIPTNTIRTVQLVEKKEEQAAVSTKHSKDTFIYPMVQPLQFSTNQITKVNHRNILKFQRLQKNKKAPKVIQMVDKQTQTMNKPVLQYWKQQTDIYNCFDNFFNGEGFRKDDITKNNNILASKRNLNEWQQERVRK